MTSKQNISLKQQWQIILPLLFFCYSFKAQQVANVIANGSFEEYYDCNPPYPINKAKSWLSIDSVSYGGAYFSICNSSVPLNGNTFQYPRTGNAHIISNFFCLLPNCVRAYPKNRLKQTLNAGKVYCVKFYVNISNTSPRGIDRFAAYFGDNTVDTITKCGIPLVYLYPQIQNPAGNVITDTLNWIPITGTFTAIGTEKYAVLGNFFSDNATTTASINTPYYPQNWTDLLIDDVSCIDMDLPAYAGRDTSVVPGASVYIGRSSDVEIDEACTWFQLPNMATPIATVAGLWVNPIVTTTYVVRQQLWCSGILWDTVVVNINPVGLRNSEITKSDLIVYPVPTTGKLFLRWSGNEALNEYKKAIILSNMGQVVSTIDFLDHDKRTAIPVENLENGVYLLKLLRSDGKFISKPFVVGD